jgi:hypothetical protein
VVERQVKAAFAHPARMGRRATSSALAAWPKRGDFEHDLVGVQQFEVTARQAFVGAVDEDQLLAHQLFGAGMGERGEHQNHIGGGRVPCACARAVEQLIAHHHVLRVDDGLARNHGHRRLVGGRR